MTLAEKVLFWARAAGGSCGFCPLAKKALSGSSMGEAYLE